MIRPLRSTDLNRFDFYAERIKRLDYMHYAWHSESVTRPCDLVILTAVWAFRDNQALLPNLRWLQFNRPIHPLFVPKMIFGARLIVLRLSGYDTEESLKPFLQAIIGLVPNLEELDMGIGGLPDPKDNALSELVCGLNQLKVLSCGCRPLTPAAILHLASSTHLRALALPNTADNILETLSSRSSHSFTSLEKLAMSPPSLAQCSTLLGSLRPLQLWSVHLNCGILPPARDTEEFFVALANSCSRPNLSIQLKNNSWKASVPRVSTDIIVHAGVLSPLFIFTGLTKLDISLACSFTLSNEQLKAMAEAWPKIEYLQLGSLLGWKTPSNITLDGLLPLVSGCPDLEHLGIVIDASRMPTTSASYLGRRPVNSKTTYLQVGDSTIEDPQTVAEFLFQIFPKVTGIGGVWHYAPSGSFTHRERTYHDDWQRVIALMGQARVRF